LGAGGVVSGLRVKDYSCLPGESVAPMPSVLDGK